MYEKEKYAIKKKWYMYILKNRHWVQYKHYFWLLKKQHVTQIQSIRYTCMTALKSLEQLTLGICRANVSCGSNMLTLQMYFNIQNVQYSFYILLLCPVMYM